MSRGGKRPGAGRPRGSSKVFTAFKLERATVELLRAHIPQGQRTAFVEHALLEAFKTSNYQLTGTRTLSSSPYE
jgi:hypothetical protein